MSENNFAQICKAIDQAYSSESRRAFATLVRLIGDFVLAKVSLLEAFTTAVIKLAARQHSRESKGLVYVEYLIVDSTS